MRPHIRGSLAHLVPHSSPLAPQPIRHWSNCELDGIVQSDAALPASIPRFTATPACARCSARTDGRTGFPRQHGRGGGARGCSKQTLYAHFGSKQELMRSVMQEHLDMATARLDGNDRRSAHGPAGIRHGAPAAPVGSVASSPPASCSVRKPPSFPRKPGPCTATAAKPCSSDWPNGCTLAMQRGQLRHDDPHYAAELLLGMIVGLDFERQRFAVPHRDSEDRRKHWAEFAVDAFLRAFSVDASRVPTRPHSIFPISRP